MLFVSLNAFNARRVFCADHGWYFSPLWRLSFSLSMGNPSLQGCPTQLRTVSVLSCHIERRESYKLQSVSMVWGLHAKTMMIKWKKIILGKLNPSLYAMPICWLGRRWRCCANLLKLFFHSDWKSKIKLNHTIVGVRFNRQGGSKVSTSLVSASPREWRKFWGSRKKVVYFPFDTEQNKRLPEKVGNFLPKLWITFI